MDKKVYEFIEKQFGDKIVDYQVCELCGDSFPIFDGDKKLLEKISPQIGGEKILLELPTHCPKCRQIQRLLFRNENNLYKVKSKVSGKPLVSVFCEDVGANIYSFDEFYNSNDFLKEIEIGESFNDNLRKMYYSLPQLHLQNGPVMENSEYNNLSGKLKNCYLCYDCGGIENALYCGFLGPGSYDVVDCFDGAKLQNSYSLIGSGIMSNCQYCTNSDNMHECYFCDNGSNLSYCIGCKNISNQEYHIFNKPVSKEEYKSFKEKYFNGTYTGVLSFAKLYEEFVDSIKALPNSKNYLSENVIGEYMVNAKNILLGWFTYRSADSRYTFFSDNVVDCMDTDFCVNNMQLSYNCITCYSCYNIISCFNVSDSKNCYYCAGCNGCSDCIGCYGLVNKQYCIFNKQYTKDEYEKLAKQIISKLKWGRFIDSSLTLFPYNDTVANNLYNIKSVVDVNGKEQIVNKKGSGKVILLEDKFISKALLDLGGTEKLNILYRTKDVEINVPQGMKTILAKDLPDSIHDVDDTILNQGIVCEETSRVFRITKTELDFYHKHNIPLPRKHSWVRQIENFQKRPSGELFLRQCGSCQKDVLSIDSKRNIYCEECYNKEVR